MCTCGGIGEHLEMALQKAGWQGAYIHRGVEDVRLPHATVPQIKQSTGLMQNIWHRPSVHGKEQNLEDSFGSISGSAWSDPEP